MAFENSMTYLLLTDPLGSSQLPSIHLFGRKKPEMKKAAPNTIAGQPPSEK